MPEKTRLPGTEFVSKDKVELMIAQALEPINRKLGNLESHAYSLYGNGSGRKGKLDIMEEVQTERWEEQKSWRTVIEGKINEVTSVLSSGKAVARDRRWWVATGLTLLSVIGSLLMEYLKK